MKRSLVFLVIVFTFFFSTTGGYARILTIDEISDKLNNTILVEYQKLGVNYKSLVNKTDKTLDFYNGTELTSSINYTDEYILFEDNEPMTENSILKNWQDFLGIINTLYAIFDLSGYPNKTITGNKEYFLNSYDEYGFEVRSENYESEVGSSDYIRYFKISFDTEKISKLMEKYGVDIEQDINQEKVMEITPKIEAKEITKNSVELYPRIEANEIDTDYGIYCYIYRSTSRDGTYEKISDFAINCRDESSMIDSELKSNTTYYYKTVYMLGSNFSDVIEVTTLKDDEIKEDTIDEKEEVKKENNKKDMSGIDIEENPQTGVFFPSMVILILLGVSVFLVCYTRKKSLFKKI